MKRLLPLIIFTFLTLLLLTISCNTTHNDGTNQPIEDNEEEPEPEPNPWEQIPDPPNNLRTTLTTHDTITIEWDEVYNAFKYKIVYGEFSGEKKETIIYDNTFTITMLQSDTLYEFEVYSGNFTGWSFAYNKIYVTTLEAYGDMTFDGGLPVAQGKVCEVYIDGQWVGRSEQLKRIFTVPLLTGWRFIEVYHKFSGPDPYEYLSSWFYLTTVGVSIEFKGNYLEIE